VAVGADTFQQVRGVVRDVGIRNRFERHGYTSGIARRTPGAWTHGSCHDAI
jgi:hypothetical protein